MNYVIKKNNKIIFACVLYFFFFLLFSCSNYENENEVTKIVEQDPIYEFNSGYYFYKKKLYGLAIENYSKAIELNPNFSEAYNNRGIIWLEQGNIDKAHRDFEKAFQVLSKNQITIDDKDIYYNLGIVWFKKGNAKLAIEDFNKAINIDPNYVKAYYSRGFVYFKTKKFNLAAKNFKTILKLDPNFPNIKKIILETEKQGKNLETKIKKIKPKKAKTNLKVASKVRNKIKTPLRVKSKIANKIKTQPVVNKHDIPLNLNRNKWLLTKNPSLYTIQIAYFRKKKNLFRLIKKYQLEDKSAYFYSNYLGKKLYILFYGMYISRQEANKVVKKLPYRIIKFSPIVRKISTIFDNIKTGEIDLDALGIRSKNKKPPINLKFKKKRYRAE